MAVIRTSTSMILRGVFNQPIYSSFCAIRPVGAPLSPFNPTLPLARRRVSIGRIFCASADPTDGKKASARLSQVQQLLQEAEERALSAGDEPIPKITLGMKFGFARFPIFPANSLQKPRPCWLIWRYAARSSVQKDLLIELGAAHQFQVYWQNGNSKLVHISGGRLVRIYNIFFWVIG